MSLRPISRGGVVGVVQQVRVTFSVVVLEGA